MSKSIWKFELSPNDPYVLMPIGARVLTAREQMEDIFVWAEVDPNAAQETRHFCVYGTGQEMPDDPGTYIGTAMIDDGRFVFHVYEEHAGSK